MRESLHQNPLDLTPDQFRALGHEMIDRIADHLDDLPHRKVTTAASPKTVRDAIGTGPLPIDGAPASEILDDAARALFQHSLFDGHPRFWGYVIASAAPAGALADLLAASVNPNVGGYMLSPVATEIEALAIRWIAELLGFPSNSGGLFVSGGNMANFVGVLAARRVKAPWDAREAGMRGGPGLTMYASRETHTWIQKAADLFGFGIASLRWVPTDREQRMDMAALEQMIAADRQAGHHPFLVVGSAGTVSTGAVDPLTAIADLCAAQDLWFHVDGAYGAPAAALPEASGDLKALARADSLAMDPHKWLYAPLEAGCALVRNPQHLLDTFSFRPEYYHLPEYDGEEPIYYFERGPQNSRGFRALKVWLGLRQAGRVGYERMIRDDIALAREMYDLVTATPELEAMTQSLSITTFRYVPDDVARDDDGEAYLNRLNSELLERLQHEGDVFVSNAVIDGRVALRACIVNFRTTRADVAALPGIVLRAGRAVHAELRRQPAPV
jgi:glutamate/tyrosine decarboxylase-like PLP-dependent enzyme